MLSEQFYNAVEFFIGNIFCMAEYNRTCMLNLIVEKLAEILHIHFSFICVNYRCKAVKSKLFGVNLFNCRNNVAQFSDSRRLDNNTLGRKLNQHLFECLAEVTNQAAADTAGIHLCYLYARLFEETAVDADLTEFIFDKDDFFSAVCLCDKLFNKRSFARAKKARENINFCHNDYFFLFIRYIGRIKPLQHSLPLFQL